MCDGCDNHFPCGCGSPVCLTGEEEYWNNYNKQMAEERKTDKGKKQDTQDAGSDESK